MPVTRHDGRSRRAAQRRADSRERLLAAVDELLGEGRSYLEISIEDVTTRAGLSRSMFYAYFEDKGALICAWSERVGAAIAEAAQSWWQLDGSATFDDLRAAIEHMVETYNPYAPLMVAAHDTASFDPAVRETLEGMLARSIDGLEDHIVRGQEAGWIDPRLPAPETAEWLTALAEGGQAQMEQSPDPQELAHEVTAAAVIIWRTLYEWAPSRVGTHP